MPHRSSVPIAHPLCGGRIPTRFIIALLGAIAMAILYGLKINLHVTILSMVNNTALNEQKQKALVSEENKDFTEVQKQNARLYGFQKITNLRSLFRSTEMEEKDKETIPDGPFVWSQETQGLILSSYFWGYTIPQMPGGRVAELYSSKWVIFFACAVNIFCTLLVPPLATFHYVGLILLRFIMGIGSGVSFPATHVLLAHWAPPHERSLISGIVYAGTVLGSVIFLMSSGALAATLGWKAVFYIEGGVCSIWMVFWIIYGADTPNQQRYISIRERTYIVTTIHHGQLEDDDDGPTEIPWKAIFTSKPFMAILICNITSNWGWYLALIELPTYLSTILHFNLEQVAFFSSLPYFLMWIFILMIGAILEDLEVKNKITLNSSRKIANAICSLVPALALICLCLIKNNRWLEVFWMTLNIVAQGAAFCGFFSNHIDIAPNFAGTLLGITNTIGTLPGIIAPVLLGRLLQRDPTVKSWNVMFWISVICYIVQFLVFQVFGTTEEQEWNDYKKFDNVEVNNKNTQV